MKNNEHDDDAATMDAAAVNEAAEAVDVPTAIEEPAGCEEPIAEPAEQSAPAESQGDAAADIGRLLEEAERRGYLRGLNEQAERAMNTPALWENPRRTEQQQPHAEPDPDFGFLTHLRPGVWD